MTDTYDRLRAARYSRDYRAKNPEKVRAWRAVAAAVKAGRLHKPSKCSRCGKLERDCGRTGIQAHHPHDDYKRPLRVVWACRACHNSIEAEEARQVRIHGGPPRPPT